MNDRYSNQDLVKQFKRSFGVGCFIIALIILCRTYSRWLKTSGTFRIQRIEIEGNDLLTDSRIRSMGKISDGLSVWQIDLETVEHAIESVGYVENAVVKRKLPDVIQIHIDEKKPVALLRYQGQLFCLDSEGQVLPSEPGKMYDLPILSGNFKGDIKVGQKIGGQWVPKGLAILKGIRYDRPHLFSEISEMILGGERGILIYLCRNGIPVFVGDDLTWKKMRCFDAILQKLIRDNELNKTKYIDIRYHGQIFVGRRA
ncbi:FtsQ-type POTRA domain-containing protein [bacterium]|nr:FtsQ-type POTRA domain-containing protein [bacterium]